LADRNQKHIFQYDIYQSELFLSSFSSLFSSFLLLFSSFILFNCWLHLKKIALKGDIGQVQPLGLCNHG